MKIAVVVSVLAASILVNWGFHLNTRTSQILQRKIHEEKTNNDLSREMRFKETLKKEEPQALSSAFAFFINQSKLIETYSGTRMKLVFTGNRINENIQAHYVSTEFRNVKGLPLTINVEKFTKETDMTEVLNDIYLLERRTDFKVLEISSENDILTVKGELYGV